MLTIYKSPRRCCSMAAYGPTSSSALFPTDAVVAPLLRPADVSSCHMAGRVTSTAEHLGEDPLQEVEQNSQGQARGSTGGWFSWVSGSSKGTTVKAARGPQFATRPYEGSVVIADRGSCMFEQKTIFAEAGGAVAVVVVNSEVRLSTSQSAEL